LDWKPGRCHNGFLAFSPRQSYLWFVLKRGTSSKAIAIENDLRGTLRNFGLKVGMVGKVKFEARIKELVENQPDLAELVEPQTIQRGSIEHCFMGARTSSSTSAI
jgi:hypothetical protein